MDNRDEFEFWAQWEMMAHDFERGEHGEYLDDFLQQSWLGWQAARNYAWLLRKQAESFEIEANNTTLSLYRYWLRCSAQRLRQQADEAENG